MIRLVDLVALAGTKPIGPANLFVPRGGYALLTGPSGGGKTTLLEAIAGLRPIQSGSILLRGVDVTQSPPASRAVGLAPQDAALFGRRTVADNLMFALALRGSLEPEQARRAAELADQLGLTSRLNQRADQLSGGEAARVALGRAAAHRPDILLLDEPFAALDRATRDAVQLAVNAWRNEWKCAVLHVTHHVVGPLPADAVEIELATVLAQVKATSPPVPLSETERG